MDKLTRLVDKYMGIWNEPDADLRRQTITELWAPTGAHYVQTFAAESHSAIDARVGRAYQKWVRDEGFVFRSANNAVGRNNLVKFNWQMVPTGSDDVTSVGLDLLILDDDGRILIDHQFNEPPTRRAELESIADRHLAVWTEPDVVRRRAAVAALWAADGQLIHDNEEARGHDAITDVVTAEFDELAAAGLTLARHGDADGHRNVVRFTCAAIPAAGGPVESTRFDLLVLDEHGRIQRDYRITEAGTDRDA